MNYQRIRFPISNGPKVPHGGTFNAHPVTLAAGLATLRAMTPEKYDQIDNGGESLRKGLENAVLDSGINAQVTGLGSLFDIHFNQKPIVDYKSIESSNLLVKQCFDLDLLNRGVYLSPLHFSCTSTATSQRDIDFTLNVISTSLNALSHLERK